MLDQQDIQQIGNIVEEKIEQRVRPIVAEEIDKAITEKIIPQIGEMIDQNILPVLQGMDERIGSMDERLKRVERDMVTKDYLDDKLRDLKGDLIMIDRKQDKKVNFLVESLDSNEILPDSDIKLLRQMEVFPSPPRLN